MKKQLIIAALLTITMLSVEGQTTLPATFLIDANGQGALTIPGQGAAFNVETASAMFNGTRDDTLVLGYNVQPNGAQYSLNEPQIRLALEANFNDGIHHWMEWNLDTVTPDLAHNRRWMYLQVNRDTGSPLSGIWTWWGTSFTLQNYNSSANDLPSEYFTVTSTGLARLTSSTGQPAQIQLNTTDSTGYPGAYTSIVFQRAYQTEWVITNQGANGDALSISTASTVVASFTQDGLFTSKGQRTAVTTKTVAYTATTSDSEIRVDCTNGAVRITLPAANATGQLYRVKKVDATANAVTIACSGADKINGTSSVTLRAQYNGATLVDGAAGAWDSY